MKKYIVIGNPIDHSLSPLLHNFWIKKNKISAFYEKMLINKSDLKEIINKLRDNEINGINVTVPFKNSIIPYIDKLSDESKITRSVNTIYKENETIIGHNTDIAGFELSLRHCKYNVQNKNILILGAGGVVSSIVFALKNMMAKKIVISNRTRVKADEIKKIFQDVEIINWGELYDFDMIINATSLGLKNQDEIKLDYNNIGSDKFFFDVIYNPKETNFLKKAQKLGHRVQNGKYMFLYQAHQAFTIWHKQMPKIDDQSLKLLD